MCEATVLPTAGINQDHPDENKPRLFPGSLLHLGSRPLSLVLAETLRPTGGWESFLQEEQEGARCALVEAVLTGRLRQAR